MILSNILIIFAKNLVHGKVKTRLASSIGADHAFEVYKKLLYHTNTIAQEVIAVKTVYFSDQIEQSGIWDHHFSKAKQHGADLGQRMKNAFQDMFIKGYKRAVIIGTDCPSINKEIIHTAFDALSNNNVVIGPAYDGGYYLLGMTTLYEDLFKNIAWSTESVFDSTIASCKRLELSYLVLPHLHDIDDEKDLVHLEKM